jgi:Lon protease-like protein
MQPMPVQPRTLNAVPLFPLPDYFLYPGVVAPLHVFEPRYRQMFEDLMDSPGRLVLTAYRPDSPRGAHGPVTLPVGTLAEIVQHEKMDDGRFLVLVAAVARVKLREVPSDRPYRVVDAVVVPDDKRSDLAAVELRPRLIEALEDRAETDGPVPDGVTIGRLADLLLHALPLDADRQARAYTELDPLVRAALAYAWHEETADEDDEDEDEAEG